VALGRAGANVFHAGKIGKDGEWVRKIMEDAGVDTTYIQVAEKEVHILDTLHFFPHHQAKPDSAVLLLHNLRLLDLTFIIN
jgi:hypothetical protein